MLFTVHVPWSEVALHTFWPRFTLDGASATMIVAVLGTTISPYYGVIAVSVLAGLVIQYPPVSPMRALFWSAVINCVVAVPLIIMVMILVSKRSIMGRFPASRVAFALGCTAVVVMGVAAVSIFTRSERVY